MPPGFSVHFWHCHRRGFGGRCRHAGKQVFSDTFTQSNQHYSKWKNQIASQNPCTANFVFDKSQTPHCNAPEIYSFFGVASSTGQGKSKQIRQWLKIHPFSFQWGLPKACGSGMLSVSQSADARCTCRRAGGLPDSAVKTR